MSQLSSTIVATLETSNWKSPHALFDPLKTELFKRSSKPYIALQASKLICEPKSRFLKSCFKSFKVVKYGFELNFRCQKVLRNTFHALYELMKPFWKNKNFWLFLNFFNAFLLIWRYFCFESETNLKVKK